MYKSKRFFKSAICSFIGCAGYLYLLCLGCGAIFYVLHVPFVTGGMLAHGATIYVVCALLALGTAAKLLEEHSDLVGAVMFAIFWPYFWDLLFRDPETLWLAAKEKYKF